MKKVLFFTVFTILGLASCSKSEIEYDNQPQEISLFAVNKVATKAPVEGSQFPKNPNGYNMMVAAYLAAGDGVTTGCKYFTATQFSQNGDYWTGGKYWPISAATLNFLAVAPEVSGVVVTNSASTAAQSVTTVSGNETWATQYDVMYATARAKKEAATPPSKVDMTFKHAYSLIDFQFKKTVTDVDIKINSITLTDVACNGTLTVTTSNYDCTDDINDPLTVDTHEWSGYSLGEITVPKNATSLTLTTSPQDYFNGILLIPSDEMKSFVINYTIDDQTFNYTYSLVDATWTAGKKYIYNITMTPSLIEVNPTVTNWDGDFDDNGEDDFTGVPLN